MKVRSTNNAATKRAAIFIVNESVSDSAFLSDVLSNFGHQIRTFTKFNTVSKLIEVAIPDLILLGVKSSDVCGVDICKQLKSTEQTKEIPIIFISSRLQSESVEKAFSAGAFDYISKPFHLNEFTARVKNALNVRQRQQEYEETVKRRTEALRKSQKQLVALINNIDFGITYIDANHNIVLTNSAQERMFHKPTSYFAGKKCFLEFEKRKEICPHCPGVKAMSDGYVHEAITQGVRDNGETLTVNIKAFPFKSGLDGEVDGFIEVVEDITEKIVIEKSLKESEEKFRNIIESSPMGVHIWELTPEGTLVFSGFNPAADKILQIDNSQFLGMELLDAFPALATTIVPQKYKEICESGIPWQTEQINYEDESVKGAFQVHAFQTAPGKMASFFLDVTESHKMQSDLALSKERMDLALSAADIAIWDWNILTGETYFSPRYFTILGYEANELPSTYDTWYSLLHEDDREYASEKVQHCLKQNKSWDIKFRLKAKDGDYRWIRGRGSVVVTDETGKMVRASGTHLDITQEIQADENRIQREKTLKSIMVAAPIGIGLVHNRVFSWLSERISEMTGYGTQELIGKSARILYPSEEEFLRVGKVKYGQLESENVGEVNTIWKKKSGELINVHLQSSPIDPDDLSRGVTFTALDITEKLKHEGNVRRLEQQIQRNKNLDSLGILAGGIAHDFNNILMAILGNLSLLSQTLPHESSESGLVEEAEKASLRAKDLTQQLLTFSKGGEPIKETSSIARVIVDSANFVLRGSKIACTYNIPDELWFVDIDKSQISQVIQNIIINAKNAMPNGGTVTVTCENIHDIQSETSSLPTNEKYIKITISDYGTGIPADILDKIFEPYFTTKQEGSGLGLATTYSIITKHQGLITAKSEIGVGTTFFIYLPATFSRPVGTYDSKISSQIEALQILVMDDEEMVRNVSKAMLTRLGHDVLLAKDGNEAISIYKQNEKPIDIIIVDLTIPGGMGGKEAIQNILKINPKAKVIVSSGYSNDPIMANYEKYGFRAAIVKPYEVNELSQVISELASS